MARSLRIAFAGALYHMTARGNVQPAILLVDGDRQRFLGMLECVVSRFHLRIQGRKESGWGSMLGLEN
jgi:putative transposase